MRTKAFVSIVLILLLLCGCNNKDSTKSKNGKNISISTISMLGGSDVAAKDYQELIQQFQIENDGIMISDQSAESSEQWKKQTIEQFTKEETTPDVIFYFTGADARELILDNQFVPIDEIRKEYPSYAENIRESTMGFMREFDGNYYCVPIRGFWEGLYCNVDLFEQYDLSLPYDWDSLTKAITVFSENNVMPIAVSFQEVPHYWIEHMILSQGGYIEHRLNPNQYVPQSWVKAMEHLFELQQLSAFSENGLTQKNEQAIAYFADKKAAMMLEGSWSMASVKDQNTTVVIPFPKTNDGKKGASDIISGYSAGFYITRKAWEDTEKREAAVKFVSFMTSNQSIAAICAKGGAPAADISVEGEPTVLEKSVSELQKNAEHVNMPIDAKLYKTSWQYFCQAIPRMLEGLVSPEEVITEVSRQNQW